MKDKLIVFSLLALLTVLTLIVLAALFPLPPATEETAEERVLRGLTRPSTAEEQHRQRRTSYTRPSALELLADGFSVTPNEMERMISLGLLPTSAVLTAFGPARIVAVMCLHQAGGSEESTKRIDSIIGARMLACLDAVLPGEPAPASR